MSTHDMHSRAILVGLRISAWSARKYDRKVSEEVAKSHGTTINAGRYNKHLMPEDAKSYKALMSHLQALRVENSRQTLPWSDDGWRVCPIKNWDAYTDTIRNGFHKATSLLSDFVIDYPNLRDAAKIQRNGMFSDQDYPRHIESRFSWSMETNPVPSGGDYRVELSDEEIAILTEATEKRVQNAFIDAQQDAVKRLHECVSKIHGRLTDCKPCICDGTGKDGNLPCKGCDGRGVRGQIFRDSLISNARELCDVLTRLNLADDPELENLRHQTECLASVQPETLRDDPSIRESKANEAQSILDRMTAVYGSTMFQQ